MLKELLQVGIYGSGIVGLLNLVKLLQVRVEEKQRAGIPLTPTEDAEKTFCSAFYQMLSLWGLENYARSLKLKKDELEKMQLEFVNEWSSIWAKDNKLIGGQQ